MKNMKNKLLITAGVCLCALIGYGAYFITSYYHVEEGHIKQDSNDKVSVIQSETYTIYDSKEKSNTAILFYGGAKVDEMAYSELLYKFAENGYDVYCIKCNPHIPAFGMNNTDSIKDVLKNYDYLIGCGHSMGGSIAHKYASENSDINFNAFIYLASYPLTNDFSDKPALFVYGTNDEVLNLDKVGNAVGTFIKSDKVFTKIIEGGNHAGFGYYGKQSGDNEATISKEEQIDSTIESVNKFLLNVLK